MDYTFSQTISGKKRGPDPLFIVKKMVAKERKKIYEKSVLVREKKSFFGDFFYERSFFWWENSFFGDNCHTAVSRAGG